MKIFLSWSGERSQIIAEALNDWLKRVIQAVKPFYSAEMEKGIRSGAELDEVLEGSHFGIICLTPDNLEHRWINYEAGALSKIATKSRVWTFLHGLKPGEVPQPLGRFQHTVAEKADVWKLLQSINTRLADVGGEPVDGTVLSENFDLYWPKLEEKLKAAEKVGEQKAKIVATVETKRPRDDRELLLEILEIARSQQRMASRYRPSETESYKINWTDRIYGFRVTGSQEGRVPKELTDRILDCVVEVFPDSNITVFEDDRKGFMITFNSPTNVRPMTVLLQNLEVNLGEECNQINIEIVRTNRLLF